MYQTPQPIWNEIAQSQQLRHKEMQRRFLLEWEAIGPVLEQEAAELEAQGYGQNPCPSVAMTRCSSLRLGDRESTTSPLRRALSEMKNLSASSSNYDDPILHEEV